ncbi:hypothetical protein KP509_28G053700 [Ceratopteris richardii]|uniref:Uncharacterized protein n=1 Tax=Ceratopteris richardii TaxID=49495 RepID=A0A8T2RCA8_CERRI|nr:hypothetical protein KP509_28G053700 [Ceratopteris richardii]
MPGKPLLSILSPSKRSRASMDLQPAQLVSVDELLDNPWHYDCVVSPRLSVDSSASLRPIYPPSSSTSSSKTPILGNPTTPNLSQRRSQASPPRSFVSPPRSAAASVNHGRSAAPTTSNYVSLAVFLNNGATQGSSYGGFSPAENSNLGKPIITLVSKCRDRDQKSYIRGHPSRIRSYSGYLAVDS